MIDISGDERQGTALGYYTAAAGLGGVIGPLMGGWLYDRFAALGAFGISALLDGARRRAGSAVRARAVTHASARVVSAG